MNVEMKPILEDRLLRLSRSTKALVALGFLMVSMALYLMINAINEPIFLFFQMLFVFAILVLESVAVVLFLMSKNIAVVSENRAESVLRANMLVGLLPDNSIIGFVRAGTGLFVAIEDKEKRKLIVSVTPID